MIARHLRCILIAVLLLAGATASPARAQSVPAPARVEFNTLVQQRNRLVVQLRQLDGQASTLIKQGRDATVVHAEQVSIQDQLDLVELRLSIVATRHGLAVPPAPGAGGPTGAGPTGIDDGSAQRIAEAFDRGRSRALAQVRQDTRRFLASLDFDRFLASK